MIGRFTDVFRSFYEHICGNTPQQQSPGNAPSPRSHTVDTIDSSDICHDEPSPQECECVQNDYSGSPSPSTMFDRPMMLLYLLAANPDFMLPLVSIRPVFGEMSTSIPQASACRTPLGFSRLYFIYLRAVVSNRLRYAINCLFPHVDIMRLLQTKGHYDLPELEQGSVPILEYIVRDAMTICNPIDYMVTFLERMVSHYRTLTTDNDRRAYRSRMLNGDGDRPLQEIYMLSHIYGRYMWDSRWASDATLHQLVQLFETLTTEIFPTTFKQVLYGGNAKANQFAFDIIFAIAPCFLHHYRPMQRPHLFAVPCNNIPSDYSYPLPEGQLPALMETLERDLIQAASEYIEHPESFSTPPPLDLTHRQDGSSSSEIMVGMPTPSFKFISTCMEAPWSWTESESDMDMDIDEAVPPTPTPQVLPSLCTLNSIDNDDATAPAYNSDDVQRQISPRLVEMAYQQTVFRQRYLEPHLPFKDFFVSPHGILYLTLSIVLCPPKDDPVFVALSPIFDQLTPQMFSPLIDRYQPSPQFRCLDPDTHTHTLPDPWLVNHPLLGYYHHTHVSDIIRNSRS